MNPRRLIFLAAAMSIGSSIASATTTVAWHLPPGWLQARPYWSAATKCDPPAHAPAGFIQPGDELWNLLPLLDAQTPEQPPAMGVREKEDNFKVHPSLSLPKPYFTGEWAIYDARANSIVARGTPNELRGLQNLLGLDRIRPVPRLKLEYVVPEHAEKNFSLTLSGDSGHMEVRDWEVGAGLGDDYSPQSERLFISASWPGPVKGTRWQLSTQTNPPLEQRMLLARQGGWELWLTRLETLPDGTPFSPVCQVLENDAPSTSSPPFTQESEAALRVEEIDAGHRLWWKSRANEVVQAQPPPPVIPAEEIDRWSSGPWIEPPPEWHSRVHGRFHDLQPFLVSHGVTLTTPGAFAGYDPLADELVILAGPDDAPALEKFFPPSPPQPLGYVTVQAKGAGDWTLLCNAGDQAKLALTKVGPPPVKVGKKMAKQAPPEFLHSLTFSAFPKPGDPSLLEAIFTLQEQPAEGKTTTVEKKATLRYGEAVEADGPGDAHARFEVRDMIR